MTCLADILLKLVIEKNFNRKAPCLSNSGVGLRLASGGLIRLAQRQLLLSEPENK